MLTLPNKPDARGRDLVDSFFYCLRKSRLLADKEVDRLQADSGGRSLDDLTEWLVAEGRLTPYQVKRILSGEPRGLVLGPYVVLEELGRGGFGHVYKAIHTLVKRVVALKVIASKWVEDAEIRELFLREVVGITRLAHPNIALAYDANQDGDNLFLALEYIEGPTLEQFVADHGPLPVPFACEVILQVAQALQYTHEKGIVHRDIKPANLLLPDEQLGAVAPLCRADARPVLVKVIRSATWIGKR